MTILEEGSRWYDIGKARKDKGCMRKGQMKRNGWGGYENMKKGLEKELYDGKRGGGGMGNEVVGEFVQII